MRHVNVYYALLEQLKIDPDLNLRSFATIHGISYQAFSNWTMKRFDKSPAEIRDMINAGKLVKTTSHIEVSFPIALTPEGVALFRQLGHQYSFAKMYDNLRYVTSGVGIADFTFDNLMLELDYEPGKPKCQHNIVLPKKLEYGVHFRKTTQISKKIKDRLHELNLYEYN